MVNVLILEDEEYTLRFLEKLVSEHPLVNKVFGTSKTRETVNLATEFLPDIAFLDIELAPEDGLNGIDVAKEDGLNGIDVAKIVSEISPKTKFVFVTGYAKYAIDSFVVHPYDYVLKPVKKSKVMDIITALANKFQPNDNNNQTNGKSGKLIIKTKSGMEFINFNDIFFIEKQRKKIIIHSKGSTCETVYSFIELEPLLPKQFMKTHKSFIVNMDQMCRIVELENRSYEIYFHGYDKVALMSRYKFEDHRNKFTPSF